GAQQHAGVDPVAQRGGDGGRGQHHVDQHVVELRQQPAPGRPARRGGQPVGAVRGQAARGLVGQQAPRHVGAQPLGGGGGGQGVPGGGGGLGGWWHRHAAGGSGARRKGPRP